jgi:Ca2+:H+ antiporter
MPEALNANALLPMAELMELVKNLLDSDNQSLISQIYNKSVILIKFCKMIKGALSLGKELLATRWSLALIFTLGGLFIQGNETMSNMQQNSIFVMCGLGLVPLAKMLSDIVELLVDKLGPRLGGLASICLGNLVEIIVSFSALSSGLYNIVVISIVGAVITNCLPILGISTIVAGRNRPTFSIHPHATSLQSQQLVISAVLFALPTVFHKVGKTHSEGSIVFDQISLYSVIVSIVVLAYYILSYVYQARTAQSLYLDLAQSEPGAINEEKALEKTGTKKYRIGSIFIVLILVSFALAGVSENLVNSLEHIVKVNNLSPIFAGLFLLPIFGAFAEGLIGIRAALNDKMDLALAISVESSAQLMLFVLPLMVLVGLAMGRYLHLAVPYTALFCLGATAMAVRWTTENQKLSWYEGFTLITLYVVMGAGVLLLY